MERKDDLELSFERAEGEGEKQEPVSCSACGEPLRGSYYQLAGAVWCDRCRAKKEAERERGTPLGRFARAAAFGTGAAIVGTAIWYAIGKLTGYEFGLIAIVIGLMVGAAVRAGAYRRGGWLYQSLAMFLTYASIVSTYIPQIVQVAMEQADDTTVEEAAPSEDAESGAEPDGSEPAEAATDSIAVAGVLDEDASPGIAAAAEPVEMGVGGALAAVGLGVVAIFALAFAAPFLGGFENLMGWTILAIGLYEAWKLNRREALVFEGPYRLAGTRPVYVPETPPPPIAP